VIPTDLVFQVVNVMKAIMLMAKNARVVAINVKTATIVLTIVSNVLQTELSYQPVNAQIHIMK
jgi:hypothetical protein